MGAENFALLFLPMMNSFVWHWLLAYPWVWEIVEFARCKRLCKGCARRVRGNCQYGVGEWGGYGWGRIRAMVVGGRGFAGFGGLLIR